MKHFLLFIFHFLLIFQAQGQAVFKGKLSSSSEAVPFGTVSLKNSNLGVSATMDGTFELKNIPLGLQTIKIQAVGFRTLEKKIHFKESKTYTENFELHTDVLGLDAVVVTASREGIARKNAPVVVNLVGKRELEAVQAQVLSEGLNYVPGVRMETNCQNCGFSQVRLNGLEGAYSQILIDGRPVFSSLVGVYGLEQIPANMIERVEVVRGGGSVLYGSNAIAGTINVITKEAEENSFSISNNWSWIDGKALDRSTNFNVSVLTEDKTSGVMLFGMNRERQAWNANPDDLWKDENGQIRKDDFTELTRLKNNSFGLRAYHKFNERNKLSLDFTKILEKRRGGNNLDKLSHLADISEALEHDISSVGLQYESILPNEKTRLRAFSTAQWTGRDSYYGTHRDPSAYGKTKDLSTISGLQVNHDWKIGSADAQTIFGAEYKYAKLEDKKLAYLDAEGKENSEIIIADQKSSQVGFFGQQEVKLGIVKVLGGLRYEHIEIENNQFGSGTRSFNVWNPKLNVLVDVMDGVQFRTSLANGFRAPQLFNENLHIEIAGGNAIRSRLNKDLAVEKSLSWTGSLDYTYSYGALQFYALAEGFYTKLNNPFTETQITENGVVYNEVRNAEDGATVKGVNLELKISPVKKLNLQTALTVQSSKFETAQEWQEGEEASREILRTPSVYGSYTLDYKLTEPLTIALSGTYTGSMYVPHLAGGYNAGVLNTENTLVKTKEMWETGIKLAYDLDISDKLCLEFSTGVQNIFNEYQKDFDAGTDRDSGYVYGTARPRTYFFGLKISSL